MMARMHGLKTYRLDETLSSGLAVVPSQYAFQVPDRSESIVTESSRRLADGLDRGNPLSETGGWPLAGLRWGPAA